MIRNKMTNEKMKILIQLLLAENLTVIGFSC